jgi:hypothetical protein
MRLGELYQEKVEEARAGRPEIVKNDTISKMKNELNMIEERLVSGTRL